MTKKHGLMIAGLVGWWLLVPLVSYIAADGWRLMSAGLPILIVLSALVVVCSRNRQSELTFLIWFPLTVIAAIIFAATLHALLTELPGAMHSQAPLEGAAMLLALAVVVVAGVVLTFCIARFPQKYSLLVCALTVVNCAAIAATMWLSGKKGSEQSIGVQILDSNSQPVSGVEAHYEVYGYGSGGSRPSSPEIRGGPLFSDANGRVTLQSKRLLHEVNARFCKPGYIPVSVNVGRLYNKWDEGRGLTISAGDVRDVARSGISSNDSVEFVVYLPKDTEGPEPLIRFEPKTRITRTEPSKRYLDIASGMFRADPSADLRFDFFEECDAQGYRRARLRATALSGAGIVEVPLWTKLSPPVSSFEQVMQMAPESGYENSIVIQHFAGTAESRIYVRGRDGNVYAVMKIGMSYWFNDKNPDREGDIRAEVFVNPTGSRRLLFDPKLELR